MNATTGTTSHEPAPDTAGLWTPEQVAKYLNISPRTVWSLTAGGELQAVRIRRCVRYRPQDVIAYVDGAAERDAKKKRPA